MILLGKLTETVCVNFLVFSWLEESPCHCQEPFPFLTFLPIWFWDRVLP